MATSIRLLDKGQEHWNQSKWDCQIGEQENHKGGSDETSHQADKSPEESESLQGDGSQSYRLQDTPVGPVTTSRFLGTNPRGWKWVSLGKVPDHSSKCWLVSYPVNTISNTAFEHLSPDVKGHRTGTFWPGDRGEHRPLPLSWLLPKVQGRFFLFWAHSFTHGIFHQHWIFSSVCMMLHDLVSILPSFWKSMLTFKIRCLFFGKYLFSHWTTMYNKHFDLNESQIFNISAICQAKF